MPSKDVVADWVNLPPGCTAQSLWDLLHDATLLSIASDRHRRTMDLGWDVEHVRKHHRLPEDTRWIFHLDGVTSARVLAWLPWPGEFGVPDTATRDEQSRLIDEYQAKWRQESVGWESFEQAIIRPGSSFECRSADLASGEGVVSLRVEGHLNGVPYEATACGTPLTAANHLGAATSVAALLRLGETYWHDFGRESPE